MLLFRLLLALITLVAMLSLAIVFYTTGQVDSASRQATDKSETALMAAESSEKLRDLLDILSRRVQSYQASAEFLALTPEMQETVRVEIARAVDDPPNPATSGAVVPLSLNETSAFQTTLEYLRGQLTILLLRTDDIQVQQLAASERQKVQEALQAYYAEPSISNLRSLQLRLGAVLEITSSRVPELAAESLALRGTFDEKMAVLKKVALALGLAGAFSLVLYGRFMSRHIQQVMHEMKGERLVLAETTSRLQDRNDQLNALNNVFSEITSTLSLRYVVQATLHESLKIMSAEMAVLRILRGNELVVAGALTSTGLDVAGVPGLEPVPLGEGPTGLTAKRGRTLRIDHGGERMMTPPDLDVTVVGPSAQAHQPSLLESGLIVPLIVGARVVGTLSCWAREPERYHREDERILEMMASQVATAIVAADTTDNSERRAHHDALTGLPNRRQLDEDKADRLARLVASGRSAVVAMVDIDHFKRFNDEFGHRVGDVTLQKVASVLSSAVRDDDHVYRYGGEEFLVVFSDTPPSEAILVANRLRAAVEAAPLSGENLEPVGPVTISIGLAFAPAHSTDIEVLIGLADRAMYKAKERGRNRVEVWDESDAPGLTTAA
ncbi:MAG TPA: diguanylate cyclase [Dehalococcoidia bacterium]|nr:diguanylate cyclase [Dehalococcoidia bacterium]